MQMVPNNHRFLSRAGGAAAPTTKATGRRRATILVMVVGLLSMLFIILSAYVTLARFDRVALGRLQKRDQVQQIFSSVSRLVRSAMRDQLANASGDVLAGVGTNRDYTPADIPGERGSRFLSASEPVNPLLMINSFADVMNFRWPGTTQLTRTYVPVVDLGTGIPGTVLKVPTPRTLEMAYGFVDTISGFASSNGAGPWGFRQSLLIDRNAAPLPAAAALPNTWDLLDAAFAPYMDADGDGVPDSYLPAMAVATDIANAQVGSTIRTPTNGMFLWSAPIVDPLMGTPSTVELDASSISAARVMMQRFDAEAKYTFAARVVSHGGKVPIARRGSTGRALTDIMFPWIQSRADTLYNSASSTDATILDQFASAGTAIDQTLARRAGINEPWTLNGNRTANYQNPVLPPQTPPALRRMVTRFANTVMGQDRAGGRSSDVSAPYDLARFSELTSWLRSNFLAPAAWNVSDTQLAGSPAPFDASSVFSAALSAYDRRHLMTTISNSDELVPVQNPVPVAQSMGRNVNLGSADNQAVLGLPAGAPKFFLGEVEKCFDVAGNFLPEVGNEMIPRLAAYFSDMLSGHEWGPLAYTSPLFLNNPSTNDKANVVTRRAQAFMLAVNTVAFAAPRNPFTGAIPAVYFEDRIPLNTIVDGIAATPRIYIGYTPQPYITQLIAHWNDNDDDDDAAPDEIALGIELYNPYDPNFDATGADSHALSLDQYAITLSDLPPTSASPLVITNMAGPPAGTPRRLNGRSFVRIAISSPNNSWTTPSADLTAFLPGGINPTATTEQPGDGISSMPPGSFILVNLWRRPGTAGDGWYLVDTMRVRYPDVDDTGDEYTTTAYRDMRSDGYFGTPDNYPPAPISWSVPPHVNWPALLAPLNNRPPRWRCVMAASPADEQYFPDLTGLATGGGGPVNVPGWHTGGPDADVATGSTAFGGELPLPTSGRAPTIPLPLMTLNAASLSLSTANTPVNGTIRPKAFPTVGFMHLIPRYSHTAPVIGFADYHCMGEWLRAEWAVKGYTNSQWPADFGHMPVFDNKQDPDQSGSSLFSEQRLGTVPWGLLVYDYFTTRNVSAPDIPNNVSDDAFVARYAPEDPRRIEGRINVNTASWYVLSGLPLITDRVPVAGGPIPGYATGFRGIDPSAPMSFRSPIAGTFFGQHSLPLNPIDYLAVASRVNAPNPALPLRFDDSRRMDSYPTGTSWIGMRVGPWLGQAIAAYRDRILYAPDNVLDADTTALNGAGIPEVWKRDRNPTMATSLRFPDTGASVYGPANRRIRAGNGTTGIPDGLTGTAPDTKYGFITLGELLNVTGFAGERDPVTLRRAKGLPRNSVAAATVYSSAVRSALSYVDTDGFTSPDYLKAISTMIALDTHFLTTRSNTFTVYTSLISNDPEKARESIRSQAIVDRSNVLPQAVYGNVRDQIPNAYPDAPAGPIYGIVGVQHERGLPEVLSEQQSGYYDSRFDN
jgi:hypothetical protein